MKQAIFPIQIRFSDIDAMGIVHNAIYFQYFEQSRLLFFRNFVSPEWDWSTNGVIVARNEADYILPVSLDDDLHVEVFCSSIGTTSFSLGYKLLVKKGDAFQMVAKGQSVMVCYNHKTKSKTALFEHWKDILYSYRGDF